MEGLRGVAIFLVFCVHYSYIVNPWISGYSVQVSQFIYGLGHIGVDLFFVLSGYLIYGSILNKNSFSLKKYFNRRLQRIYPTFLAVLFLYITLSFIFIGDSKLPERTADKVIYIIQNLLFLPGLFEIRPIITAAWSLSYEVFYYILIPLVIFSLQLNNWKSENRIFLWCIITIISLIVYFWMGGPIRLIMFISGIVLFELHINKKVTLTKGGTRFLLLALTFFGLAEFFEINYLFSLIIIFILFLLLCLSAFNQNSTAYKWLIYTPLRWLGNMSYSYYLIHGLILKLCSTVLNFFLPFEFNNSYIYYWLWIPIFVITLIGSFILFIFVERPFSLNKGRKSN
jgi:peptidoglycan/LPS O-acetylase OafA/YrhL